MGRLKSRPFLRVNTMSDKDSEMKYASYHTRVCKGLDKISIQKDHKNRYLLLIPYGAPNDASLQFLSAYTVDPSSIALTHPKRKQDEALSLLH